MISLRGIVEGNPFRQYPQLRTIWPAEFTEIAEEAARDAIAHMPFTDVGGLYLVLAGDQVIGITGFFYCDSEEEPYLRWHGIIPAERSKGYSRAALRLVVERIKAKLPNACGLTELVPQNAEGPGIAAHFAALGFENAGPLERYDWSICPWQPVRLNIAHGVPRPLVRAAAQV